MKALFIAGAIASVVGLVVVLSDKRSSAPAAGAPVDLSRWRLHPRMDELARKLLTAAANAGLEIHVTSGLRTMDEQAKLYAQGRTTPGPVVTGARPGESAHNFGAAVDVAFSGSDPFAKNDPSRWDRLGGIGEGLGLKWGGRWHTQALPTGDRPHFELPDWKTLQPVA